MTSELRITSVGTVTERISAMAESLRALDDLIAELIALRTHLSVTETELSTALTDSRSQLEDLARCQAGLTSAVETQRDEMTILTALRGRLDMALTEATSTGQRLAVEFQQSRQAAEARLEIGLQEHRALLDDSIRKLGAAAEQRYQEFNDRQSRQLDDLTDRQLRKLDDVHRAYDLLSGRQNEAERNAASRLEAIERKVAEQDQSVKSEFAAVDTKNTELRESVRKEISSIGRRLTATTWAALGAAGILLLLFTLVTR